MNKISIISTFLCLLTTPVLGQSFMYDCGNGNRLSLDKECINPAIIELPTYSQMESILLAINNQSSNINQYLGSIRDENKKHRDYVNSEIKRLESKIDSMQIDMLGVIESLEFEIIEQSSIPKMEKELKSLKELAREVNELKIIVGGIRRDSQ